MPILCFEIQIAQLPLHFIFNTNPPPPNKQKKNPTEQILPVSQSLLSWQTRPQEIRGLMVTPPVGKI